MICVYPKIGKNSKVPFQIWKKIVLSVLCNCSHMGTCKQTGKISLSSRVYCFIHFYWWEPWNILIWEQIYIGEKWLNTNKKWKLSISKRYSCSLVFKDIQVQWIIF